MKAAFWLLVPFLIASCGPDPSTIEREAYLRKKAELDGIRRAQAEDQARQAKESASDIKKAREAIDVWNKANRSD